MALDRRTMIQGLAAAAALSAPSAKTQAQGPSELRIGMPAYPASFYPILSTLTPTRRVACNLFDTLLAFDAVTGTLRGALAERFERIDERSLRLVLRPNALFHDGSPVTAEDVQFSLSSDHLNGPEGARTVAIETLAAIDSVAIENELSVIVRSKAIDPLLEQRLAVYPAYVVSARAFRAAGSWQRWLTNPVGSGPYSLVAARLDHRVSLAAFPSYWGGAPPFARLEFRIIPELSGRIAGLRSRELDLITDVSPDQFAGATAGGQFEIVGGSIQNIRYLHFDARDPGVADPRIRRAMSLAIDRGLIVESLWGERLDIPNGWQLKSFGDSFIADHAAPAYDPALARRLLVEAGYAGQPISFKTQANFYTLQSQTAQILVEMWRAVGLKVELTVLESFAQIYRQPVNGVFDSSVTAVFPDHLGQSWRAFGPDSLIQKSLRLWGNAEYNQLGRQLGETVDPAMRRSLHKRMLDILDHDDPAGIILHTSGQFYAKRTDVRWRPGTTLETDFGPFNAAVRSL